MKILYQLPLLLVLLALGLISRADTALIYEYEEEPAPASLIPRLTSFEEVARDAKARKLPILVEFSTPWCRYCEALETQVLEPLLLDADSRDRIIVQKLEVNSYTSVVGFDGRPYSTDQLSRMYGVDLYPTLVFFAADGSELSQRIVGITVLDYVAAELDQAIEQAIAASIAER